MIESERGVWRQWIWLLIAFAVCSAVIFGAGFALGQILSPGTRYPVGNTPVEQQDNFRVFWEAWHIVESDFYARESLDYKNMTYGAIEGMLKSLGDPFTTFVEPTQHRLEQDAYQGKFGGIGALMGTDEDGRIIISSLLEGAPAERAGLRAGDVVLAVDDTDIAGYSIEEAVILVRGPVGTTVRLRIERPGEPEPLVFEIVRQEIDLPTVNWRVLEDGIGYIQITMFSDATPRELRRALESLQGEDASSVVLDLRGNPGGLVNSAVAVTGEFLRGGLVLRERTSSDEETRYSAPLDGKAVDWPLVVLVDGGTASAAEIVAGAIQDYHRALLVGQRTFGKGSVQSIHELSDGSSVHVTIARWLTPNGHEINGQGLTPDVVVETKAEDLAAGRDLQLEEAISLLRTQGVSSSSRPFSDWAEFIPVMVGSYG
ncbi:MAG: S41 family peptidase [Chloroflexi bacterium]|nr:S41 family peptidase [Chloroflexota bacterium]